MRQGILRGINDVNSVANEYVSSGNVTDNLVPGIRLLRFSELERVSDQEKESALDVWNV